MKDEMDELQSWFEVPSVSHFFHVFRASFDLVDFDIEDFEETLLLDGSGEGSSFLPDLVIRLLRGLYKTKDGLQVTLENYNYYLGDLLDYHYCQKRKKNNPLKEKEFCNLHPRSKVEILFDLCNWRLEMEDCLELTKNIEADDMRILPVGTDDEGSQYYYFYGTRLYKEERVVKKGAPSNGYGSDVSTPASGRSLKTKKHRKRRKPRMRSKHGRSVKKRRIREVNPSSESDQESSLTEGSDEESESEANSIQLNFGGGGIMKMNLSVTISTKWFVLCSTVTQWNEVIALFSKGKSKNEKELCKRLRQINENIPVLAEQREAVVKKKLLEMLPKRVSERISLKVHQKEAQERQLEQERLMEEEQKLREAEERRIQVEEEKQKARVLRLQAREKIAEERALRAKQREELKLVADNPELLKQMRKANPSLRKSKSGVGDSSSSDEDDDYYLSMKKVLEILQDHEDSWPFSEPVDEEYAPNYYTYIKYPMDFSTIESKLDKREYESRQEFEADVLLVFDNCETYNGTESSYTKMAVRLKKLFHKSMRIEFPETLDEEDDDFFGLDENSSSKSKKTSSKTPKAEGALSALRPSGVTAVGLNEKSSGQTSGLVLSKSGSSSHPKGSVAPVENSRRPNVLPKQLNANVGSTVLVGSTACFAGGQVYSVLTSLGASNLAPKSSGTPLQLRFSPQMEKVWSSLSPAQQQAVLLSARNPRTANVASLMPTAVPVPAGRSMQNALAPTGVSIVRQNSGINLGNPATGQPIRIISLPQNALPASSLQVAATPLSVLQAASPAVNLVIGTASPLASLIRLEPKQGQVLDLQRKLFPRIPATSGVATMASPLTLNSSVGVTCASPATAVRLTSGSEGGPVGLAFLKDHIMSITKCTPEQALVIVRNVLAKQAQLSVSGSVLGVGSLDNAASVIPPSGVTRQVFPTTAITAGSSATLTLASSAGSSQQVPSVVSPSMPSLQPVASTMLASTSPPTAAFSGASMMFSFASQARKEHAENQPDTFVVSSQTPSMQPQRSAPVSVLSQPSSPNKNSLPLSTSAKSDTHLGLGVSTVVQASHAKVQSWLESSRQYIGLPASTCEEPIHAFAVVKPSLGQTIIALPSHSSSVARAPAAWIEPRLVAPAPRTVSLINAAPRALGSRLIAVQSGPLKNDLPPPPLQSVLQGHTAARMAVPTQLLPAVIRAADQGTMHQGVVLRPVVPSGSGLHKPSTSSLANAAGGRTAISVVAAKTSASDYSLVIQKSLSQVTVAPSLGDQVAFSMPNLQLLNNQLVGPSNVQGGSVQFIQLPASQLQLAGYVTSLTGQVSNGVPSQVYVASQRDAAVPQSHQVAAVQISSLAGSPALSQISNSTLNQPTIAIKGLQAFHVVNTSLNAQQILFQPILPAGPVPGAPVKGSSFESLIVDGGKVLPTHSVLPSLPQNSPVLDKKPMSRMISPLSHSDNPVMQRMVLQTLASAVQVGKPSGIAVPTVAALNDALSRPVAAALSQSAVQSIASGVSLAGSSSSVKFPVGTNHVLATSPTVANSTTPASHSNADVTLSLPRSVVLTPRHVRAQLFSGAEAPEGPIGFSAANPALSLPRSLPGQLRTGGVAILPRTPIGDVINVNPQTGAVSVDMPLAFQVGHDNHRPLENSMLASSLANAPTKSRLLVDQQVAINALSALQNAGRHSISSGVASSHSKDAQEISSPHNSPTPTRAPLVDISSKPVVQKTLTLNQAQYQQLLQDGRLLRTGGGQLIMITPNSGSSGAASMTVPGTGTGKTPGTD